MSDNSSQPTDSEASGLPVKQSNRKGLQLRLRSLFLFMAAFAVWTIYFSNQRNIAALESRITTIRPLARELMVDDPGKIAVVKMEALWYDENRWEIYLPAGQYRLCLATRGIDQQGFAPATRSELLGSGKHRIALDQQIDGEICRVTVTWDEDGRMAVEEPKDWDPCFGSVGGSEYSQNTQVAADQPVVLFRRRFSRRGASNQVITPTGPTEGIMLWIERVRTPFAD